MGDPAESLTYLSVALYLVMVGIVLIVGFRTACADFVEWALRDKAKRRRAGSHADVANGEETSED